MASVLRRASILSVKTSLVAVGCGVLLLGAVSTHAGASLHGTTLQGVQLHGHALQGVACTGVNLNGISPPGLSCTGISRHGVAISRSNPWGNAHVRGYGGVTSNGQSAQVRRSLCL